MKWYEQLREEDWGVAGRRSEMRWLLAIVLGSIALLVVITVGWLLFGSYLGSKSQDGVPSATIDNTRTELESAEKVAQAFLAETDPKIRLQWVRNASVVRERLETYPDAARQEGGEIDKVIGHNEASTAFAVATASGEIRLLEVVNTPQGPRVDWDAYARHGTAKWDDLWSGQAQKAVVRVFCEPSTEKPDPFADPAEWTGFRLSSPDMGQVALAFARVGTVREAMMKKVVLGSPKYRQRFVLEVVRHEGKNEPLFEITECRAVGWIEGERSVEESWVGEDGAVAE